MKNNKSLINKVGINGFGRIGRCIFRINYEKHNSFEVTIIKDIMPIENIAYLLKYDSLYGLNNKYIEIDGDYIVINKKIRIRYIQEENITNVPWRDYGVDLIIDSMGHTNTEDLRYLIDNNIVSKVICTWNIPEPDITIVFGVNNSQYDGSRHSIISSSTCTGNGVVPIIHLLEKFFGVEYCHIITIHPVLNDQKLMDSFHKDFHLGRMATNSIIPTSTSVAKSAFILYPELEGKIDCLSYRVPTAIVSSIDMCVELGKNTNLSELRKILENAADNELKGILKCDDGFMGNNKVSIDFIRSPYSSVILMNYLQLTKERYLSLSIFHDNEWGYSKRVCDLIHYIQKID